MGGKKKRKLQWDREDDEEEGRRRKRKVLQKRRKDTSSWKRAEEEEEEDLGRGKRRQTSQQRQKRLARILKGKKRPSTDEESTESDCSLEEDRPVRKRLNRIDSDDDEDEDEDERKNSPSTDQSGSDSQETDRRKSFCPSNGHWTSGAPPRSDDGRSEGGNSGLSWRRSVLSGPIRTAEDSNEDQKHSNLFNSVQKFIPT